VLGDGVLVLARASKSRLDEVAAPNRLRGQEGLDDLIAKATACEVVRRLAYLLLVVPDCRRDRTYHSSGTQKRTETVWWHRRNKDTWRKLREVCDADKTSHDPESYLREQIMLLRISDWATTSLFSLRPTAHSGEERA
jgi:hypothetical protein